MKLKKIKGQQEIAGFVLIVAIVMVALVVFLVISIRKKPEETQNVEAENMLSSMLKYTTECSLQMPNVYSVEDVLVGCYKNSECLNIGKGSCEYIEEELGKMIPALISTDGTIGSYQMDFQVKEGSSGTRQLINKISEGTNCTGTVYRAQRLIKASSSEDILVRLAICLK